MVHQRHPDIVARHVFDEHVLVPVSGPLAMKGSLFTLNAIGQAIWELLDGARDDEAIVGQLAGRFPADPARVRRETLQFIAELERLGLATPKAGPAASDGPAAGAETRRTAAGT
ncbi:MAG: PqqD family protein [Kiritimatiellae bacterium]|nr:PqqD family protein [Kiritimatiellia bacterium]